MTQQQAQEIQSQEWDYYNAGLPVGEILRRTREHYGQSLEDVEGILRIRACQLSAIEQGRDDLLPGRVYAIGFVRAYAEYLGLPPDDMVHLFKTQMSGGDKAELHFPVPASESKGPHVAVLLSSLVALAGVVGLFIYFTGNHSGPAPVAAPRAIPAVPEELRAENLSAGETAAPQIAAPAVLTNADPLEAALLAAIETAAGLEEPVLPQIMIEASDGVWIEVRNAEGEVLISRILEPGDRYTVPQEEGLVMDTGNMGALVFSIDGEALPPLGEAGDIKRNFPLDAAALQENAPAPVEGEGTAVDE